MRDKGQSEIILSVVIVTWNCRDLALRCLNTLFESRLDIPFEIIVVDNASADGTADAVMETFPRVHLIRNPQNGGFAQGNNLGFQHADGRYILLLNPDAFPTEPETIVRLVYWLDEHPAYDGVGCRLVYLDGGHQVGDAGFRPTLPHIAAHALGLTHVAPWLRGCFLVRPDRLAASGLDVDWICGACFLIRHTTLRRVGGLDERFHMYAEDLEWGCRITGRGGKLRYLPRERVTHLQGGTQSNSMPSTHWLDNLATLNQEISNGRHFGLLKMVLAAGFAIRSLIYAVMSVTSGSHARSGRARTMWFFALHMIRLRRPETQPS